MHKNLTLTVSLLVIRLLSLLYLVPVHDLEVNSQGSVTDRTPKMSNCSQLCRTSLPQYPPSIERSPQITLGSIPKPLLSEHEKATVPSAQAESSHYASVWGAYVRSGTATLP